MQTRMSPHQPGSLEILDICKLRGILPETVASQVKKISGLLVERLQNMGHDISPFDRKHP